MTKIGVVSDNYRLILQGKVCPYCFQPSTYINSESIYGTNYGMVYSCTPCQAWVGVHGGTDKALGRLANAQLRELKMQAHRWFDPIAKQGLINNINPSFIAGVSPRAKAYQWLSQQMNIQMEFCHIGMFNEEECLEVIRICQPIVEPYEQQLIDPQDL